MTIYCLQPLFHGGVRVKTFVGRSDGEYNAKRRLEDSIYLDGFGYKVYSQGDEDGIIAEIFNRIGTTNKKFVEFGVQDGLESNGHFLLHKGWQGLWIDGNKKFIRNLRNYFAVPIAKKQLTVINVFITTENINKIIGNQGSTEGEIDLLSIDIDGNDYWIWEAITCIKPRVVVIEYNAKFPPAHEWIIEYNENHIWDSSDKHGASLKSLEILGSQLGYRLVGTSRTGINAFFVRNDLAGNLFPEPATAENLYNIANNVIFFTNGHPSKQYIGH
ncbi:MAG: hypothetical protein LBC98_04380 [Prevotellaceae bacterium]|nr:hypothetical protein [Prevotellaceae bacterium]